MGGFKRQLTNSFDPASPTTLGDLAAEGLRVSAGATGAAANAEIETAPLIADLAQCFRFPNLAAECSVHPARPVTSPPVPPGHGMVVARLPAMADGACDGLPG